MRRRILFVTQQMPWPKDSGGNIRTYFMLAGLARHHDVILCSTTDGSEKARDGEQILRSMCAEVRLVKDVKRHSGTGQLLGVARSLLTRRSAVLQHNLNPALRDLVRAALAGTPIDSLHLNHIDTTPYVDLRTVPPTLIDTHNLLFDYYDRRAKIERGRLARMVCRREARILRELEPRTFARAARVVVCSEAERSRLLALGPRLRVEVVPNGVDCESVTAVEPRPENRGLVFVGDLAYGPNRDACLWFIRKVLPLVREREPRAHFLAVGKNPPAELEELGRKREEVTVTGLVDDVAEWIRRAECYVVPIRYGSGTRLKVLEAFAHGMPTVSTAIGAEGIDYVDGEDILIRDDPGAMAEAILGLFSRPETGRVLARRARVKVEQRYDWAQLGEQMAALHHAVATDTNRSPINPC